VEKQGANFTLKADDQKMNRPFLIPEGLNGAKPGEKVIAEMAEWTNAREMPKCNVVRIFGKAGEHEVEIHAILAEFDLPAEFPAEVEEAAENIPAITAEEIAKRRDMRDIITLPSTRTMPRIWTMHSACANCPTAIGKWASTSRM
jgi:exoribonuclease R